MPHVFNIVNVLKSNKKNVIFVLRQSYWSFKADRFLLTYKNFCFELAPTSRINETIHTITLYPASLT